MNSPKHYAGTILIDALLANAAGFCEGNICKYVVRWRDKDGLKDLYKARDYLNVLITHAELNQPLHPVTLPVQGDLFKDQQS